LGRTMTRRLILFVGIAFATLRFAAFLVVWLLASTDAQWQLAYLPFWVTDFPMSLVYRFFPVPLPEALFGPVWWFCVPVALLLIFSAVRPHTKVGVRPN
jgi:hypothetical protein